MNACAAGAETQPGRIPPHDIAAEEALIGAVLLTPHAFEATQTMVTAASFYRPGHGSIWAAIEAVDKAGAVPDTVTVAAKLAARGQLDSVGGHVALIDLQVATPAAANATDYAQIIADHERLRALIASATGVLDNAFSGTDPAQAIEALLADFDGVSGAAGGISGLDIADIGTILEGSLDPEEPQYLVRSDGSALFYAAKLHMLQAEPSFGKSWIALGAVVEVLKAGGTAVYVDYEDTPRGILGRLLALGATPTQLREQFAYAQSVSSLGAKEWRQILGLVEQSGAEIVVFDGVAEALARDGLSEDSASEFLRWLELPRSVARTGAAVIMLDHIVKSKEGQGRWARGTGAKLGAVDGAAYQLKMVKSFSRHSAGAVRLVIAKDKPGGVGAIGETAAVVGFDPSADGAIVKMSVDPNAGAVAVTDTFRPTIIMERCSKMLEESVSPLTAANLKVLVSGKPRIVAEAIARLISDGYFIEQGRTPKTLVLDRPFRQDGDRPDPPPGAPSAPLPENVIQLGQRKDLGEEF